MSNKNYKDFVHTGPGTLAGRYMRLFWQPVYRAQDLAPGQAVPIRIMSEDFTLYRGEGGISHLVAFRCAHRGTQLSVGWVEEDCIRCFFHGWKYDGSGQCVEQPGGDESYAKKVRIRSYPTKEYLGLIFAYFGEGDPSPLQRYPEFEGPGILDVQSTDMWPCNYFNRLDNAGDPVHVPFVHRESRGRVKIQPPIPELLADETEYGIKYSREYPGGKSGVRHYFMPNIVQITLPVRLDKIFLDDSPSGGVMNNRLLWRVPIDDNNCIAFGWTITPLTGDKAKEFQQRRQQVPRTPGPSVAELGDAVLTGKLRIKDIGNIDNYKLILVEDYIAQVGQGTMVNHPNDHLHRTDVAIILLRKIWERELRALAEGRPVKPWKRPESLNLWAEMRTF